MMDEFQTSGGNPNKRKWVLIAIGTGVIAIFLLIRRSMNANAAAAATAAATPQPNPAATITDTGAYPSDTFGGGISGTGMDQTLSTYLAIADQNTSVQMGALNDKLGAIQSQFTGQNADLQKQISAINTGQVAAAVAAPAQPVTTSTPAQTAHPDPTMITHVVQKGDNLYRLAIAQYGSPHAAISGGGIATIAKANNIVNPNKIYAGQTIQIPTKLTP